MKATQAWLRALERTAPIAKHPERLFPDVIQTLAITHGDAPALLSDRESLTYRALAARANRYARWALDHGVTKGDTVALLMPNRPEYMAIWLGITSVGGVVALVNTHQIGASLAHGIDLVAARHIIVDAALLDALGTARPLLANAATIWTLGADDGELESLDLAVARYADAPLAQSERPRVTVDDRALCIYTSGTTGLPKAANV